jgi:hypothetical protein
MVEPWMSSSIARASSPLLRMQSHDTLHQMMRRRQALRLGETTGGIP